VAETVVSMPDNCWRTSLMTVPFPAPDGPEMMKTEEMTIP
jgi:hypothetical protein